MNGLGFTTRKRAVDVERARRRLGLEPLAEHDLEDVAGLDVFLALLDRRLVFACGRSSTWYGSVASPIGAISVNCRSAHALLQALDQAIDALARRGVAAREVVPDRRGRGRRRRSSC